MLKRDVDGIKKERENEKISRITEHEKNCAHMLGRDLN